MKKRQDSEELDLQDKQPWDKIDKYSIDLDIKSYKKTDIIPEEFYQQDGVTLAKKLLGKVLVRQLPEGIIKCKIVETEAYMAPQDKGSHACKNKKTDRTKILFEQGGNCYVYMIYGKHYNLNIVAYEQGVPQGVLIRAVEPLKGEEILKKYRSSIKSKKAKELTGGPGKFCQAMKIDKSLYGKSIFQKESNLYIEMGDIEEEEENNEMEIVTTKRININYAEEWVNAPYRFYIKNNQYVSVL